MERGLVRAPFLRLRARLQIRDPTQYMLHEWPAWGKLPLWGKRHRMVVHVLLGWGGSLE